MIRIFQEKKDHQAMVEEERELFDLADKDKNGLLTVDEYARVSQPHEYPEMHNLIVKHALHKKDTDKDGEHIFWRNRREV